MLADLSNHIIVCGYGRVGRNVIEELKVEGIKTSEPLMVSVGTATTVGVVTSARENRADMALKIPVVAEPGQRVAVSRRIGGKCRAARAGNGDDSGLEQCANSRHIGRAAHDHATLA